MRRFQRGITLMGFVILLAVMGFFALIAMNLFPAYSEFNSVKSGMESMKMEPGAANFTIDQMWTKLDKRFYVSYVKTPTRACLKLDRKNGVSLTCTYEYRTKFIYNIDFVVRFAHTVKMGG